MRLRITLIVGAIAMAGINSEAYGGLCQPCPAGQTSDAGPNPVCRECGLDYYCPGGGARYGCTPGTKTGSNKNATSLSDCKLMCVGGQKYNGVICESCPGGQYQDSTAHQNLTCKTCPTNSYSKGTTGSSASAACNCNAGLVWQSNQNSGCCALNNGTCLTGNVGNNRPSGVSIEGGCFTDDSQKSRGASAPGGGYCHCRGKTANGAVSSWASFGYYSSGFSCANNCANYCANYVSSWGASASW